MDLWYTLYTFVSVYLAPLKRALKRLWRAASGSHEVQRLVSGRRLDARRLKLLELSLRGSQEPLALRLLTDPDLSPTSLAKWAEAKGLRSWVDTAGWSDFVSALTKIRSYHAVATHAERLSNVAYTKTGDQEQMLAEIWNGLTGEPLPARLGPHWQRIGFQGNDPATDFRGMGELSLIGLHSLATRAPQLGRHLVSRSNHPKFYYSFAIVSINITSFQLELMRTERLKTSFYNIDAIASLEAFNEHFWYLLDHFDKLWFAEEPENMLEFTRIFEIMKKDLIGRLNYDMDTVLVSQPSCSPAPISHRSQFNSGDDRTPLLSDSVESLDKM